MASDRGNKVVIGVGLLILAYSVLAVAIFGALK
jgi:hypothetical protein